MDDPKQNKMSLLEYFAFRESIGEEILKDIYYDVMEDIARESDSQNTDSQDLDNQKNL